MKNITGSPARSDDFFDRETEQRRLWERLDTDSVLTLAPRRVGKTSLLYRFVDTARAHGYRAVYLDVSKARDEGDVIDALIDAVAEHPDGKKLARDVEKTHAKSLDRLRAVKVFGAGVELGDAQPTDWRSPGEELLGALAASEHRWLIMLDEIALFTLELLDDDRARGRDFLNWLRAQRTDRRQLDRVRWILCGSIGLDTVTARARIGNTINDLAQFPLGAFSNRTTCLALGPPTGAPTSSTRWPPPASTRPSRRPLRSVSLLSQRLRRKTAPF